MKILVAAKRVLDYADKVRVKSDGTGVDLSEAKLAINPFDEVALEAARRLQESGEAQEIIAVSIGSEACHSTLLEALARGASRAIHVISEEILSPLTLARIFEKLVVREQAQLVLLGRQSIDSENQQIGQMLAGILDWPQATSVSQIQTHSDFWQLKREIDNGTETLQIKLPMVMTVELNLYEPRQVTVSHILKAKYKTIEKITLEELQVQVHHSISILNTVERLDRKSGTFVPDVSTLIEKLQKEAKVL